MSDTLASMRSDLVSAGYREIAINSFDDLIGGCRYVTLDPDSLWQATQYIPSDTQCWFGVYTYRDSVCKHLGGNRRSQLSNDGLFDTREWFGKPSKCYGVSLCYTQNATYTREATMSFKAFISNETMGSMNPYSMESAFNAKHPVNPNDRVASELGLKAAQLKQREEALKQQEVWSEYNSLMSLSGSFAASGNYLMSDRYRTAARELQKRVQSKLDAGLPVEKEGIADIIPFAEATLYPDIVNVRMLPVRASKKTLAEPAKKSRSILLDEEI